MYSLYIANVLAICTCTAFFVTVWLNACTKYSLLVCYVAMLLCTLAIKKLAFAFSCILIESLNVLLL